MATDQQATIDDLYHVEGKAELVDGEIVRFPLFTDREARAAGAMMFSLHRFERNVPHGIAFGPNVGFLCDLPHRKSFCPDAAFYMGPRGGKKFLPQPPVFAVEVRSPDDYGSSAERRLAEKRADYFAAGTMVVWDVDLDGPEVIRVYRASDPEAATVYGRGETAEAEPAVPGWTMAVDELFD